jgi:hypothetical protein
MRKKRSRRAAKKKTSSKKAKAKRAAAHTKKALKELMRAMSNQRMAEEEAGEHARAKFASRKQLEHALSGGRARDTEAAEAAHLMERAMAAFSNAHLRENGNGSHYPKPRQRK